MSDSLWPHGLQHARHPCPSPTPGACSNSCPLSQRCHPTISSSVALFCFQSFPALGSFSVNRLFPSGGKYWSVSISPSDEYSGLISFKINQFDLLAVQRTLKSLLQYHDSKASVLQHSVFFMVQLTFVHNYLKNYSFDYHTFIGKVMSLFFFFNMLIRFIIAFLPRSKHLLISWLQSPSAVVLGPPSIKHVTASTYPLLFVMKWWDQMPDLSFLKVEF